MTVDSNIQTLINKWTQTYTTVIKDYSYNYYSYTYTTVIKVVPKCPRVVAGVCIGIM